MNKNDRVARAVHDMIAAIKDTLQNEVVQLGADERMQLQPGQVDRINIVIGEMTDVVYFKMVDDVVKAAVAKDSDSKK